jgi:hypothetical protein
MSFTRLRLADWVAFAAALALLFLMAMDWYTTKQGAEFRRDAGIAISGAATHGQGPDLKGAYNEAANKLEKNAWQAHGAIDRLILIALLATVAAALVAAFARAAGRRFKSRLTPSAIASFTAIAALAMLAYRILQPPGWNPGAVVKAGAFLALLCVTVLALAERVAVHNERDGTAWSSPEDEATPTQPGEVAPQQ